MAHAFLSGPNTKRTWFCTKVPYESRKAAKIALERIKVRDAETAEMGRGTLHIYKCKHCGKFHLGHWPPKGQQVFGGLR